MTTKPTQMLTITEPGVYNIHPEQYHADPVPDGSLSSSGARMLLPPSCPALFHYERINGRPPNSTFDLGHAAHLYVLGAGPELVVVDAVDWRTKAAKDQRDKAYEDGKVPLLAADHETVQAMAAALRQHPIAAALFQPERGEPEQSLFWTDQRTGVWRRARVDWLPHPGGGRMIVADYKTARSAAPTILPRAIHDYGYHQQAAWYLDGVHALGLADDAAFVFVVQEKTPPYLVTVVQLDGPALRIGRDLNRQALEIYRDCQAVDVWPGYSTEVELISLPAWVQRSHTEEIW